MRVIFNGSRAHTRHDADWIPVITIPAVPCCSDNYRSFISDFIDHEAGHIRFTDHKLLEREIIAETRTPGALKAIQAIYEDFYVDRMMGECFTGCRRNLRKLCLLAYASETESVPDASAFMTQILAGRIPASRLPWSIWNPTINYMLRAGRKATAPRLCSSAARWRAELDVLSPDLAPCLDLEVARGAKSGINTAANLELARRTVALIRSALEQPCQGFAEGCASEIAWLLRNSGEERERADIGE